MAQTFWRQMNGTSSAPSPGRITMADFWLLTMFVSGMYVTINAVSPRDAAAAKETSTA
jgi:hypothetical protein